MNLMDIATQIVMDEMPGSGEVSETIELVGWGTFEELRGYIPQRLFGEIVKKAMGVVENYHSDLYHDALWIKENINGVTDFDLLIRPNGTNVGQMAVAMADIDKTGTLYNVRLWHDERERWFVTFTTLRAAK